MKSTISGPGQKPKNTIIHVTDSTLIPSKSDSSILSAWNISFFGALITLSALVITSPKPYFDILKILPKGLGVTFLVTIMSIICSILLGLFVGLGRISRIKIINIISTVYVEIIRGIPLFVQLVYIYFGLAKFIKLDGVVAAILAMSICYGAYLGEIFRAGIQAVPKGQMEAALALGMSRTQAIFHVILPQTIKIILPPIGNEFIALLKDSSLVSILSVPDILRLGKEYASSHFTYFEVYTVIALVYLILTLFFSRIVGLMEEGLKIPYAKNTKLIKKNKKEEA